jgi:hypothetical protein
MVPSEPCPNCPFYFARRRTSLYGSYEFTHFTLVTVRRLAFFEQSGRNHEIAWAILSSVAGTA